MPSIFNNTSSTSSPDLKSKQKVERFERLMKKRKLMDENIAASAEEVDLETLSEDESGMYIKLF